MATFTQTLSEAFSGSAATLGGTATDSDSNDVNSELAASVVTTSNTSIRFLIYEDVGGTGTFDNFATVQKGSFSNNTPISTIGGSAQNKYYVTAELLSSEKTDTPELQDVSVTFNNLDIVKLDEVTSVVREIAGRSDFDDGFLVELQSNITRNGDEVEIIVYEDTDNDGVADNFQQIFLKDGQSRYRLETLRGNEEADYWFALTLKELEDPESTAIVDYINLSFAYKAISEVVGHDEFYPQFRGVQRLIKMIENVGSIDINTQPFYTKVLKEAQGVIELIDFFVGKRNLSETFAETTSLSALSDLRRIVSVSYKTIANIPSGTSIKMTFFEDTDGNGTIDNLKPVKVEDGTNEGELPFTATQESEFWWVAELRSDDKTESAEIQQVEIETLRESLEELLRTRR